MANQSTGSRTERYFLKKSSAPSIDRSVEKVPVVTMDNYVELGRLSALRFLEWVCANPEGVAALPSGRTPEYFIRWVLYYLKNWKREFKSGILGAIGFDSPAPPSLRRLRFVQLDEFFPIGAGHERSFFFYVNKYYIRSLGLDPSRALLINVDAIKEEIAGGARQGVDLDELFCGGVDLGLRLRRPSDEREALRREIILGFDTFCERYEKKIRELGGIGFFLGGIGPDGHVAFNVKGSSHFSSTRLAAMNYETMAAAAQDLGGIESARQKAVITIGLETIAFNPDVTAVLMAAGEAKAKVVADAVENGPHIDFPASSFQKLPNARFYLTTGAASRLRVRSGRVLAASRSARPTDIERLVIDTALESSVALTGLKNEKPASGGLSKPGLAARLSKKSVRALASATRASVLDKIEAGLAVPSDQRILHTGPHHDDIELAYFPYIHHLVRSPDNTNYFCYLTSGFTSVTNGYLLQNLHTLRGLLVKGTILREMPRNDLLDPALAFQDIHGYLNAIGQQNADGQRLYASCRLCRNLFSHLKTDSDMAVLSFIDEHIRLLEELAPGKPGPDSVHLIKGWIREWEAELVWEHFGLGVDNVHHLRLQFYKEQIFPEDPQFERDVVPVLGLLEKIRPTIITLALDPESSGPDTHFKALMALRAALEKYVSKHGKKGLRIWGYRNVWSRFHIADVNTIIPVSLNSFAVLHNMFNSCFKSQASASFPSYEYDGTFAALAQKIWVEQFNQLCVILGKDTFGASRHPMMRRAFGAIYLKNMSYDEFVAETDPVRALIYARDAMHIELH
jgi:glucosamine-6-phosphate deaminase